MMEAARSHTTISEARRLVRWTTLLAVTWQAQVTWRQKKERRALLLNLTENNLSPLSVRFQQEPLWQVVTNCAVMGYGQIGSPWSLR